MRQSGKTVECAVEKEWESRMKREKEKEREGEGKLQQLCKSKYTYVCPVR